MASEVVEPADRLMALEYKVNCLIWLRAEDQHNARMKQFKQLLSSPAVQQALAAKLATAAGGVL